MTHCTTAPALLAIQREEERLKKSLAQSNFSSRPSDDNENDDGNELLSGDGDLPGGIILAPKKRFFRQRAHANVFSDHDLF